MFSQRITVEEYEKQKKDYTSKALNDLQEQMKLQTKSKLKLDDIMEEEDDDLSSLEDEETNPGNINVIINHVRDKKEKDQPPTSIRRRKPFVSNKTMSCSTSKDDFMQAVYGQRELEMVELEKHKNKIRFLKNQLNDEEKKNHFLRLDLNNATVENNCLMEKISKLTKDNEELNATHISDMKIILIFKIFIAIFILLTLFSNF